MVWLQQARNAMNKIDLKGTVLYESHLWQLSIKPVSYKASDGGSMNWDMVALEAVVAVDSFRIVNVGFVRRSAICVVPHSKMLHAKCACRPLIIVCEPIGVENLDHRRDGRRCHH